MSEALHIPVSFNIRIDTPNIKGIEFKFSEAPDKTKSMAVAIESLKLDKLLIVYPGQESWPVNETISVCPIDKVEKFLVQQKCYDLGLDR